MDNDFNNYFDDYYYDIFSNSLLYNQVSHREILRIHKPLIEWNHFRIIKILGYKYDEFSEEYMIETKRIKNESDINEFTYFGLIENKDYLNIKDEFLQEVLVKTNLQSYIMLGILVSFDKNNPKNTFKNNTTIFKKLDPGITIKELSNLYDKIQEKIKK